MMHETLEMKDAFLISVASMLLAIMGAGFGLLMFMVGAGQ